MSDTMNKPSRAVTVLGIVLAIPAILFFFALGVNEYIFPAVGRFIVPIAALIIGIALRLARKQSGHEVTWVLFLLSLYSAHMAIGGYTYLGYWALPVFSGIVVATFLIFRRRTRLWRILAGISLALIVGLFMLQIFRNFDLIDEREECLEESLQLPDFVTWILPENQHPYDFGGHAGSQTLGIAFGMGETIYLLNLPTMSLIKGDEAQEGIQRITPHPTDPLLAMPAWGHWGEQETVFMVDDKTGMIRDRVLVPGCRNVFEAEFAAGRMYVLCEVSHSLHELEARSPYRQLRKLTLPGMDSYDLAIDPQKNRAYVTDWFSPWLVEADLDAMQTARKMWIGFSALGAAFGPDGLLYVAQPFSRCVRVIDTDAWKIVRTLKAGYGPRDLAFDPRRELLFVGNYFDGTVDVFRLGETQRQKRFFAGRLLRGLWIEQDRDLLLLATGCGIRIAELSKLLGKLPQTTNFAPVEPLKP